MERDLFVQRKRKSGLRGEPVNQKFMIRAVIKATTLKLNFTVFHRRRLLIPFPPSPVIEAKSQQVDYALFAQSQT